MKVPGQAAAQSGRGTAGRVRGGEESAVRVARPARARTNSFTSGADCCTWRPRARKRWLHLLGTCNVETDETAIRCCNARRQRPRWGCCGASQRSASIYPASRRGGRGGRRAAAAIARDPVLRRLPVDWTVRRTRDCAPRSLRPSSHEPSTPRRSNSIGRPRPHVTSAPSCIANCSGSPVQARSTTRIAKRLIGLQSRFVAELAELGVPLDRRETAAVRALEAVQRTLADRTRAVAARLTRTAMHSPNSR